MDLTYTNLFYPHFCYVFPNVPFCSRHKGSPQHCLEELIFPEVKTVGSVGHWPLWESTGLLTLTWAKLTLQGGDGSIARATLLSSRMFSMFFPLCYRKMLKLCGETEDKLAQELIHFELQVERDVIEPLFLLAEVRSRNEAKAVCPGRHSGSCLPHSSCCSLIAISIPFPIL